MILKKERQLNNLQAIKALNDGSYTPEILEKYSGYGGIGKEMTEYAYYSQLTSFIEKSEINKLKATSKTAYYTPPMLVNFIYQVITELGFKGGNILEPAAGNGIFIKHMPARLRKNSKIMVIEPEPVAFKILKTLYTDVTAVNKCFEEVKIENNTVDLVIGNPPYAQLFVNDKYNEDLEQYAIHNYFVARAARLLKKNGIIALVVSQFFMDNSKKHVRNLLKKEGMSLIASYRLPETMFDHAKVTVDIIFLIKAKLPGAWHKSRQIVIDGHNQKINEYYINNSDNVLGELAVVPMYDRKGLTCKPVCDSIEEVLVSKLATFPKNLYTALLIKDWIEKSVNRLLLSKQGLSIIHVEIEYITSYYTFLDMQIKEITLDTKDWYYEIAFVLTRKASNATNQFEQNIIAFLRAKIGSKFNYKLSFSYG